MPSSCITVHENQIKKKLKQLQIGIPNKTYIPFYRILTNLRMSGYNVYAEPGRDSNAHVDMRPLMF